MKKKKHGPIKKRDKNEEMTKPLFFSHMGVVQNYFAWEPPNRRPTAVQSRSHSSQSRSNIGHSRLFLRFSPLQLARSYESTESDVAEVLLEELDSLLSAAKSFMWLHFFLRFSNLLATINLLRSRGSLSSGGVTNKTEVTRRKRQSPDGQGLTGGIRPIAVQSRSNRGPIAVQSRNLSAKLRFAASI